MGAINLQIVSKHSYKVFQNLNAVTNRFNASSIHHIAFPKANETVIDTALKRFVTAFKF